MTPTRRFTLAVAGVALGTAALLATAAPVAAHDGHDGGGGYASTLEGSRLSASGTLLTPAQIAGVIDARRTYIDAAHAARASFRSAVVQIQTAFAQAMAAPSTALEEARDAYVIAVRFGGDMSAAKSTLDAAKSAYVSALAAARSTAMAQLEQARATAAASIAKARLAYTQAIAALFPAGTPLPAGLETPPGRGLGWLGFHTPDLHAFGSAIRG
jgi:hypothetical protein